MAAAGSAGHGADSAGGGEVEYGPEAPPIPSVPGNDSPYPDEDADFLQLLQWPPTTNFTIGVYTHSAGDHYLIKVASGRISAAPLNLTGPGQDLKSGYLQTYPDRSIRSTAVGGADEQIKHEAYVLGQSQARGDWVEIGTYRLEGNALHYGWNFNWDGSSAVCVTQRQNTTADGKLSSWTARVYFLTITEEVDGEGNPILVGSIALDETAGWQPSIGYPYIMFPNNAGLMVHWIPQSCEADSAVDGYGDGSFKAPVYAFYKSDETVETIRYKQDALPEKSLADLVDEAREMMCPCLGWQFNTPGEHTTEYFGALSGRDVGFYTDSADYSVREQPGGFWKKQTVIIGSPSEYVGPIQTASNQYAEDWTHTEWDLNECQGGYQSHCKFDYNADYVTTKVDQTNEAIGTTFRVTASPLLALPYHSPESAYIGTYVHTNRYSQNEERTAKTGVEIRQVNWQTAAPASEFVPVYFPVVRNSVVADCDDLVSDCRTLNRYIFSGGGTGWDEIPEDSINETIDINTHSVSLALITPFEHLDVDSVEKDSSLDLGSYIPWFFPALCGDALFPLGVNQYQSALGNSIRLESGFDYSFGSNNGLSPYVADPYGIFIGRA